MSDRSETADRGAESVIARIVAAHSRQAVAARDRAPVLTPAWDRALRHAAVPFRGLDLTPRSTEVAEHVDLATALDALPGHGLIAALEDPDGGRGLIALSHGAVDALVEVQTTGRVDARELPPRPVTRIDEALCRDFIDLALAAFARETRSVEDCDWPARMGFGSRIADRRQLALLLPDRTYHALTCAFELGDGKGRSGQAVLVLPRIRDPRPRAVAPAAASDPEAWQRALSDALADAPLDLEAVLVRTRRSLREIEALGPGDLLHFDRSDLAQVRLEAGGKVVTRGRLGQIAGQRAVRVSEGATGLATALGPGGIAIGSMPQGDIGELAGGLAGDTWPAPDAEAGGVGPVPRPAALPGDMPSFPDRAGPSGAPGLEGGSGGRDPGFPGLAMDGPTGFAPRTIPIDPSAFPE